MADRVFQYAGGDTEPHRLRIDERPDGGVTITVPTRRSGIRWIGGWTAMVDIRVIPLAPLLWVAFMLFRPRAVLRMTPAELIVTETADDGLGWHVTSRWWPRSVRIAGGRGRDAGRAA